MRCASKVTATFHLTCIKPLDMRARQPIIIQQFGRARRRLIDSGQYEGQRYR